MTWTRHFISPASETIQDTAQKVAAAQEPALSEEYQHDYEVALEAASKLVDNDDDRALGVSLAGWRNGDQRNISVQVYPYVPPGTGG